jgi:4-amino-4-deoxy-L-arabinose transferase-like glycosyltransferase
MTDPAVWRAPFLSRLERLLEGRRRFVLAVFVAVLLLARALYFVELSASPHLVQHLWEQSDMQFFDRWGRAVAEGDWLSRRVGHPFHLWHAAVAFAWLQDHPEEITRLAPPGGSREQAAVALWDRWYGGPTFHQEPLYAYLVALTYRLLGPDVRHVFAWQLLVGVGTGVLLLFLARRLFGHLVGTTTALLTVLCSPLLYYELVLLRETVIVASGLLMVAATMWALERRGFGAWLLAGLASGLALLLKSSMALLLAGTGLGLLLLLRRTPWELVRAAGGLALGLALALAPAVARNVAVGVRPLALSSVGTITFVNANAGDSRPELGFFVSRHAAAIMGGTDGRFGPAALATLRTHPDLSSYLRQLGSKLATAWHWYELPNNSNFYQYRAEAPVLRLPFTFALAGPLGLVGLALAAPRWRSVWILGLLVATSLLTMLVFYPLSRFRAPMLGALVPFAAFAVVRTVDLLASGRIRHGAVALLAVLGLAAWMGRPLPPTESLVRGADCGVPVEYVYRPALERAAQQESWAAVASIGERALEGEPAAVRRIGAEPVPLNDHDRQCAAVFAGLAERTAEALDRLGRAEAARRLHERARVLAIAAQRYPRLGD